MRFFAFVSALVAFVNLSVAANFSIVVHESCNEIRLTQEAEVRWALQSAGGGSAANPSNTALYENILDEIHFGRNALISFKLNGKHFIPEVLSPNEVFGSETNNLYNDQNHAIVGKFISFTDPSTAFRDATGSHARILFAVMFVNPNTESVSAVEPCDYVNGDIDLNAVSRGKCLWVDKASRASNGKAYCW